MKNNENKLKNLQEKVQESVLSELELQYRVLYSKLPTFYTLNDGSILEYVDCNAKKSIKELALHTVGNYDYYNVLVNTKKYVNVAVQDILDNINAIVYGNPILYVMDDFISINKQQNADGSKRLIIKARFDV